MPLALVPASTRRKIGILVLPWVAEHSAAGFGNRFETEGAVAVRSDPGGAFGRRIRQPFRVRAALSALGASYVESFCGRSRQPRSLKLGWRCVLMGLGPTASSMGRGWIPQIGCNGRWLAES